MADLVPEPLSEAPSGPFPYFQAAAFVLVPILLFAIVEVSLVRTGYGVKYGWFTVDEFGAGRNNDFIFVGTSRTICAVNAEAFWGEINPVVGRWYFGQNMGSGGTRMVPHYLGLRNLYESAPDSLVGTTFLVEAPAELPEYTYWTDNWVYETMEARVIPEIRMRDVPRLMRINAPISHRLDLLMRYVLEPWVTFDVREQIRHEVLNWGTGVVEGWITRWTGQEKEVLPPIEDIVIAGGVVSDPAIARDANALFNNFLDQEKDILYRPWRNWERTVLNDFVEMVNERGGRVVFFDVPQTTRYDEEIYWIDERTPDREAFHRQREVWGTPYIRADFDYTDSDFPDNFHLAASKSIPFSKALAQAYIEQVMIPAGEVPGAALEPATD